MRPSSGDDPSSLQSHTILLRQVKRPTNICSKQIWEEGIRPREGCKHGCNTLSRVADGCRYDSTGTGSCGLQLQRALLAVFVEIVFKKRKQALFSTVVGVCPQSPQAFTTLHALRYAACHPCAKAVLVVSGSLWFCWTTTTARPSRTRRAGQASSSNIVWTVAQLRSRTSPK